MRSRHHVDTTTHPNWAPYNTSGPFRLVPLARRRIKSSGDMKAALKLIPITKPVFAKYRALVEREYPHLVA